MKNQKALMQGTASLNLMATTENAERFKLLLDKDLIIDAKATFLTHEGETITADIMEFLQLQWTATCPETGEPLEEELAI